MSDKSIQKKQYIIDCARKVFIEKGYKDVTMKDVVEECNISRGGLYLYFGSTEELFKEVMKQDKEESGDSVGGDANTPFDILAFFLKEQKKDLLKKKDSLTVATYEYFFAAKAAGHTSPVKSEFNEAFHMIEKLIRMGVEVGQFVCEDPEGTARNFLFALEGMKVYSQTMGLSADMIDKEFAFLLSQIVVENE